MLVRIKRFLEGMIIMRFSSLLAGLVASYLMAAPALANPAASPSVANPASLLSVAKAPTVKAATTPKKASKLSPAVGVVGGGILLMGALLLIDGDGDSRSDSR